MPPRQGSLQRDHEVTTDVSIQLQGDRETSIYTTSQQVFTPTSTVQHDEVKCYQPDIMDRH